MLLLYRPLVVPSFVTGHKLDLSSPGDAYIEPWRIVHSICLLVYPLLLIVLTFFRRGTCPRHATPLE